MINDIQIETNERINIDELIDAILINHEYIARSFY